MRPTLSGFRMTSRCSHTASLMANSLASEAAASMVQETDMSDRVLPPREAIMIIRSQSNSLLYLLMGLIALGAVGIAYWMIASHSGPTSTTTVIMSAPTAGPAATSGDVRHSPDRPAPDNRPRDSAPAQLAGAVPGPDPALALGAKHVGSITTEGGDVGGNRRWSQCCHRGLCVRRLGHGQCGRRDRGAVD